MREQYFSIITGIVLSFIHISAASARVMDVPLPSRGQYTQQLPSSVYQGDFYWLSGVSVDRTSARPKFTYTGPQYITLRITDVKGDAKTKMITGWHDYRYSLRRLPGETVSAVKIEGEIDMETQKLVIREINVNEIATFETDGQFTGTISKDGKWIKALWKTTDSGDEGMLVLRAAPDASTAFRPDGRFKRERDAYARSLLH